MLFAWTSTWTLLIHLITVDSVGEVLVRVPEYRRVGESATLMCDYDLQDQGLYSVKWFKNNMEFYRFMPRSSPPQLAFNDVAGVRVNTARSDERVVRLEYLSSESTGRYYCEVSAEAPSFNTGSGHAVLVVVELPSEDPVITGQSKVYAFNGVISLNCTSQPSLPSAALMWFINTRQVARSHLRAFPVLTRHDGLQQSRLAISMPISPQLFRRGELRLTCVAYIQAYNYDSEKLAVIADKMSLSTTLVQRRHTDFVVRSGSCSCRSWTLGCLASTIFIWVACNRV